MSFGQTQNQLMAALLEHIFFWIWDNNQTTTSLAYNFRRFCRISFFIFGSERKYSNVFKSGLFWPKVKNAESYPKFCAQNDVTLDGVVGRFCDSRSLFDLLCCVCVCVCCVCMVRNLSSYHIHYVCCSRVCVQRHGERPGRRKGNEYNIDRREAAY